jgi:hypothetical protein
MAGPVRAGGWRPQDHRPAAPKRHQAEALESRLGFGTVGEHCHTLRRPPSDADIESGRIKFSPSPHRYVRLLRLCQESRSYYSKSRTDRGRIRWLMPNWGKTMVTRIWLGGNDNNNAGDPANWSPAHAPRPGDTLIIASGTIAVSDNDLAGDILSVQYPSSGGPGPVINLDDTQIKINATSPAPIGGALTVNAAGHDQLGFLSPEPEIFTPTVNLAAHAHLLLTGNNFFFTYFLNGGPDSEIINDGTLSYNQTGSRIDTGLAGTGIVNVTRAHDGSASLEVNGSVGKGQTFDVTSSSFSASLIVDRPHDFHGAVNIEPDPIHDFALASIVLKGLHATSFDLKDDILKLYDGHRVVDSLRLTNLSGEPMTVAGSGSNIVVDFGKVFGSPGTVLPPHHG